MSNYDKAIDQAQAMGAIREGVEYIIPRSIYRGMEPLTSHFFNSDGLEVATFYHKLSDADPHQMVILDSKVFWNPDALSRLTFRNILPQSVRNPKP